MVDCLIGWCRHEKRELGLNCGEMQMGGFTRRGSVRGLSLVLGLYWSLSVLETVAFNPRCWKT